MTYDEETRNAGRKLIDTYFDLEWIPSDSQMDMFMAMTDDNIQRLSVDTLTQFGKSIMSALSVLWQVATTGGDVVILAPTETQTKIIMGYIIEHVFDHPLFMKGLSDVAGLEKYKTQRTQKSLVWSDGKSIKAYTVSAGNSAGIEAKSIMGVHADYVLLDESYLIPNGHYAKILRMLGGNVATSKIVKLGNPWHKYDTVQVEKLHHAYRSRIEDDYEHIIVDYKQAIKEGRMTKEFIDEARKDMSELDFKVLYKVEVPDRESEQSVFAQKDIVWNSKDPQGYVIAGLDVSGAGDDDTYYTLLHADGEDVKIKKQEFIQGSDLQLKANEVHERCLKDGVHSIGIDVVGIGKGLADILTNKPDRTYEVIEYIAGASPQNKLYFNLKSELIFLLWAMFKNGVIGVDPDVKVGGLVKDMLKIRQTVVANRKKKTEDPKDSPDKLDSLLAGLCAYVTTGYVNLEFF